MTHPKALPHDPPLEIAEDLFVVHGCVGPMSIVRFTRNMTVVRHNGELTLINSVRMNESGLQALEALGDIKHVMRLGPLHGMDDEFYVDRYSTSFWGFDDGKTYTTPKVTHSLSDQGATGSNLPFPNATLFAFNHVNETEGAILLHRGPGVLLAVDAIQSYSTPPHKPHTGWFARKVLTRMGFTDKTLIGPIWVKKLATDKTAIKGEFERLLTLEFDQLISAHGTFVKSGAKQQVTQAFAKMFEGE